MFGRKFVQKDEADFISRGFRRRTEPSETVPDCHAVLKLGKVSMIVCYKWGLTDIPFLELNRVSYCVYLLDEPSCMIRSCWDEWCSCVAMVGGGVDRGGSPTSGEKMNLF
jgi:hypothetical protein